jgi:outer membrane autotransporter protein
MLVTGATLGDATGASFSVTGINIPRDTAVLGLGLSAEAKRNLRLYADSSAELNSVQRAVVFSAGMRYQW